MQNYIKFIYFENEVILERMKYSSTRNLYLQRYTLKLKFGNKNNPCLENFQYQYSFS